MKILKYLINLGVRETDTIFLGRLKKAVNILNFNAIICILVAFLIAAANGDSNSYYVLFGLPFYTTVIFLNLKGKSYTAITMLFVISALMLAFFSLRTGSAAFTHSLFILNIIGVSLIYRKESPKVYFYFNLIFTFACLTFVLIAFETKSFEFLLDQTQNVDKMRTTNLIFLIACSIVFSIVVIVTNNRQYNELENALKEQKVLLAELHHRVKNNLSVIMGLLNLSNRASADSKVSEVLSDVRDRVMSMALVHDMMYQRGNKSEINVADYCEQLISEVRKSMKSAKNTTIQTEIESIQIDISNAIPLGLILNELLTNSFKHAFEQTKNPVIHLEVKQNQKKIHLSYRDNGSGLDEDFENKDSLGLNLIQGLTEQLEGHCKMSNNEGFLFEMNFKKK